MDQMTPPPPDRAQSNESVPQCAINASIELSNRRGGPETTASIIAKHAPPVSQRATGEWTQVPPTLQGEYWHWNGDQDSAPLPMFVLWSGHTNKCFVSMGQLGITQAVDCDEYGGWWMPLYAPPLPEATPRSLPHGPGVELAPKESNVERALAIANRLAGRQLVVDVERDVHLIINALNAAKP